MLLLLNVWVINGDVCRCRCCTGQQCDLLQKVFTVEQCWRNGGASCLERCLGEYRTSCRNPPSTLIPVCRASSTVPLNIFITSIIVLMHRFFIH
jgi:hypothetical protein